MSLAIIWQIFQLLFLKMDPKAKLIPPYSWICNVSVYCYLWHPFWRCCKDDSNQYVKTSLPLPNGQGLSALTLSAVYLIDCTFVQSAISHPTQVLASSDTVEERLVCQCHQAQGTAA